MADRERPWSKFYWSDWESDLALRQCSLAAQGLWMRMLCICAKADPRGYLTINGVSLDVSAVATHVSRPETEVAPLMAELERWGVFSRDRKERIYSRRIIRDEKASNAGRKSKKEALSRSSQVPEKNGENLGPSRVPSRGASPHIPEARSQNITAAAAGGRAGFEEGGEPAVPIIVDTDPDAGAPALIRAFDAAILTVWGQEAARMPVPGDDVTAGKWQDAGVTPEMVRSVAERVFRRSRQQNRSPPKALGYLTEPLMEQLTAVATPLLRPRAPAGGAAPVAMGADPMDSTWRGRVSGWQRNGYWDVHQWGPAPTQPGCKVPHKILLDLRVTSEVA